MKRFFTYFFPVIFFMFFLSGCRFKNDSSMVERTDFMLNTVISVRLYDGTKEQLDTCMDMIRNYDALFSDTDPDSDISRINSSDTYVTVDPETIELLNTAISYANDSDGLFDPAIGALTSLWDFHSDMANVPDEAALKAAAATVDCDNIHISGDEVMTDGGTRIDLGGIAKGYITDRLRDYLISEGVTSASISLGGNVYIIGEKPVQGFSFFSKSSGEPFTVGIQKPFSDNGTPACTIQVRDKSVVTSGVYQRYFKKDGRLYHHLLDTATGCPIENGLYSVTIISDDSVDGDALSTAVFAMGLSRGLDYVENLPGIEAIFITDTNDTHTTSGMDAYNIYVY